LPPAYAIECIKRGLEGTGFKSVPTSFKSTYQSAEESIVSGPDIVCWGDSMTAGAGGGGTSYPSVLESLIKTINPNANVRNSGVGGENSVTIAARQGGNPFVIRVDGGV